MGGATSRFGEVDWDAEPQHVGDSAATTTTETLDGAARTSSHVILNLQKPNIVNQREFTVVDETSQKLYYSKAMEGTTKWFDLFSASDDKKLFCVHTDAHRETWTIYTYEPAWEGQAVDYVANANATLYRKARIDISWNKSLGSVFMYHKNDSKDSKGVVDEFVDAPVLHVETIQSMTPQYQSYKPTTSAVGDVMHHPPLVGWWVWEHTPKLTSQFRMHLTQGQDMALHTLVAIVTHMVTIEQRSEE